MAAHRPETRTALMSGFDASRGGSSAQCPLISKLNSFAGSDEVIQLRLRWLRDDGARRGERVGEVFSFYSLQQEGNVTQHPKRETVDLSQYPDLVVIYLGMRVNTLTGLKTVIGFGPQISAAVDAKPDGLLLHEPLLYSWRHLGMREYWRDFESMEAWARSEPHRLWWQRFLRDSEGTGFWHETYLRRGGFEAVYVDMPSAVGMARFAPVTPARGAMFTARKRAGVGGEATLPEGVRERDFYD